jgi:hypothetical protein
MWISAPTKAASLLAFCVPPGSQAWPGFPLARLQRGTKFPLKLFSIFGFAMRILALGFDSREPVSAFRSSVVRSAVTLFRPVAISTGFDFRFLRSAVVTFSFCSVLTLSFPPARLNLRSGFHCLRSQESFFLHALDWFSPARDFSDFLADSSVRAPVFFWRVADLLVEFFSRSVLLACCCKVSFCSRWLEVSARFLRSASSLWPRLHSLV